MKILVDTSVLIRFTQRTDALHERSERAISVYHERQGALYVVPQIVYEYWSVCTRPRAQNGLGMGRDEGRKNISELQTLFTILRDERRVFEHWLSLLNHYDIYGKATHDARIVAAMIRHGVSHILTFDEGFRRFEEIAVIVPDEATSKK